MESTVNNFISGILSVFRLLFLLNIYSLIVCSSFIDASWNHLECNLCQRQFIFIIAEGRSGSTTLLHMVNHLPDVELTGEHYGILKDVNEIFKKLTLQMPHSDNFDSFYHKNLNVKRFKCWAQDLIWELADFGTSNQNTTTNMTIRGFKEIRYADAEVFKFINDLFPCAKYIFNYRSNAEADKVTSKKMWDRNTSFFLVNTEETLDLIDDSRKFIFTLEEYSELEKWNALSKFLGRNCTFHKVLHDNANYGYRVDKNDKNIITCD